MYETTIVIYFITYHQDCFPQDPIAGAFTGHAIHISSIGGRKRYNLITSEVIMLS